MIKIALGLLVIVVFVVATLFLWRFGDERSYARMSRDLLQSQPTQPDFFEPSMVEGLPEPAQRYFVSAIAPSTALRTAAEIKMIGNIDLGSKANPQSMGMNAAQVLAFPRGFLWNVEARRDHIWISGADGAVDTQSFSRFWLLGFLPVARVGGTDDHARSSFGRYAAEAVFWTPAALLPREGVLWEATGENSARVTLTYQGFSQPIDITVDQTGRPIVVEFDRWTDANPDKVFRWQRFGGYLSEFRDFDGFTLPTHVEAGNQFGSDAYYPFFQADVTSIRFPQVD